MSLTLLLNPARTISGVKSRTIANRSQAGYSFQRADYEGGEYTPTASSNEIVIFQSGFDFSALFTVGDLVYIATGDGVNAGTGTIITVFNSNQNIRISCDFSVIGSSTVGVTSIVNNFSARPFYRIEIQLLDTNGAIFADNIAYQEDPSGAAFIDVQAFLRPRTFFDRFENYRLNYRENWRGNTPGSYTTDEEIQAISANLTLYGRNGANMWDYLLKDRSGNFVTPVDFPTNLISDAGSSGINLAWTGAGSLFALDDYIYLIDTEGLYTGVKRIRTVGSNSINVTTGGTNGTGEYIRDVTGFKAFPVRGQFLTAFRNGAGCYWQGWTNRAYILGDPEYKTRVGNDANILVNVRQLNINRGTISGSGGTNVNVPFAEAVLTVNISDPVDNTLAGFEWLRLITNRGAGNFDEISERYFLRAKAECEKPVMLEFRNELGGFDTWLFSYSQTITEQAKTSVSWERRIEEPWEDINRTYERGILERQETIRLIAENIPIETYEGLAQVFTSNEVYVWLNKQGTRKIGGVVQGNQTKVIRTKTKRRNFSVTLALPNDFKFLEALEYSFE